MSVKRKKKTSEVQESLVSSLVGPEATRDSPINLVNLDYHITTWCGTTGAQEIKTVSQMYTLRFLDNTETQKLQIDVLTPKTVIVPRAGPCSLLFYVMFYFKGRGHLVSLCSKYSCQT